MDRLTFFPKLPGVYDVPFHESYATYYGVMHALMSQLRRQQFRDIRVNMNLDIERRFNRYYETT